MTNFHLQSKSTVDADAGAQSTLTQLTRPDLLRGCVIAMFAALVILAWTRNVNWDEFYFLSHVHAYFDGRLDRVLQTFFVHGFNWLRAVPGHEMEQIFAARLVMTVCLGVTAFSIYRISSSFSDRNAAWVALLGFLTSGFVLAHGASFRADPIAASLLMSALAILITGRLSFLQLIAVALLSGLAILVTIKSVLYLPAFVGALIWRSNEQGALLRIFLSGILGLVIAALLLLWHSYLIDTTPEREAVSSATRAGRTVFLENGIFVRWRELLLWTCLSIGVVCLSLIGLLNARTPRRFIVFLAFLLPFAISAAFYRNAFPYFFPFIVPPMIAVAAVGAARLKNGIFLGGLVLIMIVTGTFQAAKSFSEGAALQRETLAEVHRLFPEPVPYIDQNGMVSSFPRDGFFMSTWGMTNYRKKGLPVMSELIERTRPPLLLANQWVLQHALTEPEVIDHPFHLFPEDRDVLRNAYVHYSGAIWLAGREITLTDAPIRVDMSVPGFYRLETPEAVQIDGKIYNDGDVVDANQVMKIIGPDGLAMRLIWATPNPLLNVPLQPGDLYAGFWQLLI